MMLRMMAKMTTTAIMTQRRVNLRFLTILVLFLFLPFSGFSQLVNIEKQRKELKDGWVGDVQLSFKITSNTSKIYSGNAGLDLQYTHSNNVFLLLSDLTAMRIYKDDSPYDLINKNFEHFRYNYLFPDVKFLTYEAFVQHQQNKIKYQKLRFLAGTGLRFRLINGQKVKYYFAPLLMYEYEVLSDSAQTLTQTLKGDLYHSLTIKFGKAIYLSHVTYYQPAILNLGGTKEYRPFVDFRLSTETSLTFVVIDDKLEISTDFNLSYDSNPPQELRDKPLFYSLSNKLRVKF